MAQIPSPSLRAKIPLSNDLRKFLLVGDKMLEIIKLTAKSQGVNVDQAQILEIGCGCGMVMRHWNEEDVTGIDVDKDSIKWCRENFSTKEFDIIDVYAETDFNSRSFDLIYAPFFFMSLTEELQDQWIEEVKRLLKPKGVFIFFLRSQRECLYNLSGANLEYFKEGRLVVIDNQFVGTLKCRACHPKLYIDDHFPIYMPIIDYSPAQSYKIDGVDVSIKSVITMRALG